VSATASSSGEDPYRGFAPDPTGGLQYSRPLGHSPPPMKFRAATGKRWRKVEGIGHAKKIGESEVGDV